MPSSRSGAKLFVAFAALGAALLLAHPFRRDGTRRVHHAPQPTEHVVLRETSAPGDFEIMRPDAPTAEIQPTLLPPPPDAVEHRPLSDEVNRLAPPPTMARSFPGSTISGQDAVGLAAGFRTPNSQRTLQRTHVVRDGDTLEGLAQRYLGDRSRWREIFQANRDQVQQPELLPLTARLVIPPKLPRPTAELSQATHVKPVAQAPLVPLAP